MSSELRALIDRAASAAGFGAVGVTHPAAIPEAAVRLRAALAAGRHGDMAWLAANADRRADPAALWPEVKSIVMLGRAYAPAYDPLAVLSDRHRAGLSVYAQGRDYHDLVKAGLVKVARAVSQASGADVRVFVDTAPLMEKPLAAAAGLGWQGRHTNLVSRQFGSWLFLGAVLTTATLAPDMPEQDHCGSCRRCLDVCPTAAFPAPYQLDARRCIAYLTIEHKGHIAAEFRRPIGNRVFGCDDCLAVCPWNKFAKAARANTETANWRAANPPIGDLLALDDAVFRARFAGTPIKRTGRDRVVRNALIAAGNSGDTSLLPAVERLLDDGSSLVRAMAVWALRQLADGPTVIAHAARRRSEESDPDVRAEWDAIP
jgi:epoxyqueuosine reductase